MRRVNKVLELSWLRGEVKGLYEEYWVVGCLNLLHILLRFVYLVGCLALFYQGNHIDWANVEGG